MPLLQLLQIEFDISRTLPFFNAHGVFTWEDFLLTDSHKLQAAAGGWMGEASAEECQEAIAVLSAYLSSRAAWGWTTGTQQMAAEREAKVISTGCKALDDILGGGVREGRVTELVGCSACGKTQVCLQTAASAAFFAHASVAYVDTSDSFTAKRIAHIVGGFLGWRERLQAERAHVTKALRSVVRIKCFDIFSLLSLLDSIFARCQLATEANDFFSRLRLIVVDSASSLVTPILGGSHPQGHCLMMSLSRCLRRMAEELNIAVLTTCHMVAGSDGHPKASLGESWRGTAHVRLLLERGMDDDVSRVTCVRHTSEAPGASTSVRLEKTGVVGLSEGEADIDGH